MFEVRFALCAALAVGLMAPSAPAQVRPVNTASATQSGSYLGIWVWEIDAARAKELRLPQPGGIEVTLVSAGSPADLAGMKAGDVIDVYNGQKVDSIEHFSRLVRETPGGKPVKIQIVRNGTPQVLTAKIETISAAERPGPITAPRSSLPQADRQDVPRSLMTWRSPVLGVEAEPLFGQLAGYFGVTEGVLVRTVTPGSPAEKADMKAGDVITRINKSPVTTPAEIAARLRTVTSPAVAVTTMRERKEITLTVTLE
jgi:serine protease Do